MFFVCLFFSLQSNAQPSKPLLPRGSQNQMTDDDFNEAPLGVDLMAGNLKGITVYPNPANDHIIVSLAGKPGEKRQIRMMTAMGQSVLQLPNLRENSYMLDVSCLLKGIYVVEVTSKGRVQRTKWIKQ